MKPEKMKMTEGVTHNRWISGYNQACTDYEYWLKQSASVEKIEKTIKKYFRISTQWDSEELAKAIHKLIGK